MSFRSTLVFFGFSVLTDSQHLHEAVTRESVHGVLQHLLERRDLRAQQLMLRLEFAL